MYSRRGTLLIALSTAAAWAILHLNVNSAPCGCSFTRPMALSWRWSSGSRLEHISRNFFRKGHGGGQTPTLHKKKPMLRIRGEVDWSQQDGNSVGFGKHKFQTYSNMVHNDPHYCAYVVDLDNVRSNQVELRDFQDYLQGIGFKAPLSFAPGSKSKNAGKTFKEVMETQPFYCSWVLSNEAPSLARFRSYLEDEGFEAPDMKGILPFGRYQGKSYAEVMKTDPSYCMWIKNLPDDHAMSDMVRDFQEYLQEQGCEDVLTFGKHSGMRCKDVMAEDPSYCSWVIGLSETQTSNAAILGFKRFLEEHGFSAPAEDVLVLGKHRGKTFKEVMDEDPSYCSWVRSLSTEGTNISAALVRFNKFLENQGFSVSPSAEEVLAVGKHKGKTFEEVMTEHPQFSSWVLKNDSISSSNLLSFRSFLQDKGFQPPSSQFAQKSSRARPGPWAPNVIPVGKHKGKTFKEVMDEDPAFCGWVMRLSREGANSSAIKKFNTFLEDQGFSVPPSAEEVLGVGEHKGKTFEEVMTEHPQFCSWVLSEDSITSSSLLSFRSFLQDKGVRAPSSPTAQKSSRARPETSAANVVPIGKHKGKTFEEVMREDPSYCSWVMSRENRALASFKAFLEDNGFAA